MATYFTTNPVRFASTKRKFVEDVRGISRNAAEAIAFVTNQELSLEQRKELELLGAAAGATKVEIYHLERVVQRLLRPSMYAARLEFLDIEMTKEEQVAFFANAQRQLDEARTVQNLFRWEIQEVADTQLSAGSTTDHPYFMSLVRLLNLGPGPASNISVDFTSGNGYHPKQLGTSFSANSMRELISSIPANEVLEVTVLWNLNEPPEGWLQVTAMTRTGDPVEQTFPIRCHMRKGKVQCQVTHLAMPSRPRA